MDIGVPYRDLARVDVAALQAALIPLTDEEWDARPIRRASLSGGPHASADSIVMRHEWTPSVSARGFKTLSESLLFWAERKGRDGRAMLPLFRETNSECDVYTFPDWVIWQAHIMDIVTATVAAISPIPRGVLTRALFVRLAPGGVVEPHRDEQKLAAKTHRIHVCISDTPGCIYTIGDTKFSMTPGVVYDFNNSWTHGVRNDDERSRINLMLEYLPNPEWVHPMPIVFDPERQATLKKD